MKKKMLALSVLGAGAAIGAAIAPSSQKHPLEPVFRDRCFAHRGLYDNSQIAENSLEAFSMAAEGGYGIELDVQLSADNQVVVFHDDCLLRMCGIDAPVNSRTYQQLSQLPLGDTAQSIPLFQDVLKLIDGSVPLIVELKSTTQIGTLCLLTYDLLRNYKGPFCIESFNPLIVDWFRKNAPQIMRGQLAMKSKKSGGLEVVHSMLLSNLMYNFLSRPHFIAYDCRDNNCKHVLFLCRAMGAFLVGWTVHEEDYERCCQQFDSIIFEGFYPPRMIERSPEDGFEE